MDATNNKILVSCDLSQKDFMQIGDVQLKRANNYDVNYRERSPVIAQVMEDKGDFVKGDVIICHHNLFYEPSPYFLKDTLFSIPYGNTIFLRLDKNGEVFGVCGNIIAEQIDVPTTYELPPRFRKKYTDRVRVLSTGYGYDKWQLVFTKPYTPYEIVYVYGGIEQRIVKINSEMIIGKL